MLKGHVSSKKGVIQRASWKRKPLGLVLPHVSLGRTLYWKCGKVGQYWQVCLISSVFSLLGKTSLSLAWNLRSPGFFCGMSCLNQEWHRTQDLTLLISFSAWFWDPFFLPVSSLPRLPLVHQWCQLSAVSRRHTNWISSPHFSSEFQTDIAYCLVYVSSSLDSLGGVFESKQNSFWWVPL